VEYDTTSFFIGEKIMGGQHGIGGTTKDTPEAAAYHINKDPTVIPDCTGNYYYEGTFNGQPLHRRGDYAFYIYAHEVPIEHAIIVTPGVPGQGAWNKMGEQIAGSYYPLGSFLGHPVVIAGPG
jgi:hypothetical protein